MFYDFVFRLHGRKTVHALKNLNKCSKKLVLANCKRIFLLACRKFHLVPKFVQFRYGHVTQSLCANKLKADRIIDSFKYRILQLCVDDVHVLINILSQRIRDLCATLKTELPDFIIVDFIKGLTLRNEALRAKVNCTLANKFRALKQQALTVYFNTFQPFLEKKDSWIQNISDTQLPDFANRVLCLGPKFCIPYFKMSTEKSVFRAVPVDKIIINIENKLRFYPPLIHTIRSKVCNAIKNYNGLVHRVSGHENVDVVSNKRFKECFYMRALKQDIIDTYWFIRDNPQIKIVTGDKTNKTVVLNSVHYSDKMKCLLGDSTTYKKINNSLVPAHSAKNNFLVKTWFNAGFISKPIYENMKVSGTVVSRIYGLIKLHKQNFPLRPIVSSIGSPFYALSKFLSSVLTKIVGCSDFHVPNSFDFFKCINNMSIPEDYKLISLDVVSMYTNISCDLAVQCVEKRWDEVSQHCSIPKDQFLYALSMCISSTVFQFEDCFYQQIKGLAMGGSVSAVLANIVMEDFEIEAHNYIPFLIFCYKRYVDDIFLIVHQNEVRSILQFFNSRDPSIQFTLEEEVDGGINFLDMTVMRTDNVVRCKWFQKQTSSGRYLNFLSVQPNIIKKNVVANLAHRIVGLSDECFLSETVKMGKRLLLENCYPPSFIDREFAKVIRRRRDNGNENDRKKNIIDFDKLISLPYIPFLSENLAATLRHYGFFVVHTQYNNLSFLMSQLKSKRNITDEANVVYYIPCRDCDMGYVGQTKQVLKKRLSGHRSNKGDKTALQYHQESLSHHFNFEKAKILASEKRLYPRLLLEMMQILRLRGKVCNYRADVDGLSAVYHQFFLSEGAGV